jgi:hypothetical protein
MLDPHPSADDMIPPNCQLIDVRVSELKQLSMRWIRRRSAKGISIQTLREFIVGWARDLPQDAPLGLIVYLDRPA